MATRRRIIIFTVVFLTLFSVASFCQALSLKDAFRTNEGSPLNAAAEQGAGFRTDVTFNTIVGVVIATVMSLMGVMFLILAIYAGYTWMMARGNEEMVEKAKNTLINALIGLAVVLSAYAISYFVLNQISPQVLKENPVQEPQH